MAIERTALAQMSAAMSSEAPDIPWSKVCCALRDGAGEDAVEIRREHRQLVRAATRGQSDGLS